MVSDNVKEDSLDEILGETSELEEELELTEPQEDSGGIERRHPSSPQFLDVSEPDPNRFDNSTAIFADGMNIETIMGSLSILSDESNWPLRTILELHGDYDFETIHDYANQEGFELWTITDEIDMAYMPVDIENHYNVPVKGSTAAGVQSSSISGFTAKLDEIRNDLVLNDLSHFFETLYREAQEDRDLSEGVVEVARNYTANLVENNTDFQGLLSLEYDKEIDGVDDLEGIGSEVLQDVSAFLSGSPEEGMAPRKAEMLGKVVTENEIVNYSNLFEQEEVPYNLVVMYSMDLNEDPEDVDYHMATASRRFAEIGGYTVALASKNLSENYVNSVSDKLRL